MYARTTSFSGPPDRLDDGITFVRDEVMPALMKMPGCLGMSFIIDQASGRCIATSSWESLDALEATEDRVAPMRERGREILGADPMVEQWEVAIMHRDHVTTDGACCRVTWGRTADLERMLDRFRYAVMPRIEEMEGFCSTSMLVDRAGGRFCGTTVLDSRAALDASRDRAAGLRAQTAQMLAVEFTDVAEFDLAIAHLRLPELV